MGIFERYLSLWVFLAIVIGVIAGYLFPGFFQTIGNFQFAQVNGVIAVLIWLMIFPMMLQIDFSAIKDVGKKPKGLFLTLVINWLIKPFTMALLGWIFFKWIFSAWVDDAQAKQIISGMILLGVAPCTAMVFVWSQLTKGDPNYTLAQVAVNDLIMIFAFAPIAGILLGISDITVPWDTLLLSVLLYIILPLMLAVILRKYMQWQSSAIKLDVILARLKPLSQLGLILTVAILFALQAETIIQQPLLIVLIAIPLLIQSYGVFFITLFAAERLALPKSIAGPACLIGTSNFFELAVAVAIGLFGLNSFAALATVVGVLVEVPVMLSLVAFINRHQFKTN